jgi:capsular polysaccharide export protein
MDTSKPSVLYFIEAHPIRNSFTEHFHIAKTLGPILGRFAFSQKIDLRIFANQYVAKNIRDNIPKISRYLVEPNEQESRAIESEFGWWNKERIDRWVDMINGIGEPAELYCSILERLHSDKPIDVVMLWSENGGVRRFSKKHGVPTLHGELGPTRPPFLETFYFDSAGTNGNAALRFQAEMEFTENYQDKKLRSNQDGALTYHSWILPSERISTSNDMSLSPIDLPLSFNPRLHNEQPKKPYVFVAMQLADDLNTLLHSPYHSLREFLDDAIKRVTDNGFHAIIKGHPAAAVRPFNLRSEVEAIRHIQDKYKNITILDRNASIYESLYTLANARYSISINSSMSFESLLLGVPTVILGDAVFDAGRKLQDHITMKPANVRVDFSSEIDSLVSTYLSKFFVPKDCLLNTDYLLNLLAQTLHKNKPSSKLRMSDWYLLGGKAQESNNDHQTHEVGSLCVGAFLFEGEIQIEVSNGGEELILSDCDTSLRIDAASSGKFIGYIDDVTVSDESLFVSGWCLETKTMKRPIAVIAICGNTVVQESKEAIERHDVRQAFPLAGEDALFAGFSFRVPILDGGAGLDGLLLIAEDLSYNLISTIHTACQIGSYPEPRIWHTWLSFFRRIHL